MKNKRKILIMCAILLFILFSIRTFYQEYSSKQIYHGCIVLKKIMDESEKYIVINPNNIPEFVVLDFRNCQLKLGKKLGQPIFADNSIYLMAYDLKGKSCTIIKIFDGKMEILPVTLPYSNQRDVRLLLLKNSLVVADDESVFFISKRTYKVNVSYTARKAYTNILPYQQGVITISKNNEVLYLHDDRQEILFRMPVNYFFEGWFQIEENFLVYDKKTKESIIINLSGKKIQRLGNQPYSILGNQDKNSVLLEMLPTGSGGATMLDFEYDGMDLLRAEHRYCYQPYIYNINTKDIRNLKMELNGFQFNSWQKLDFDKSYLERLADSVKFCN